MPPPLDGAARPAAPRAIGAVLVRRPRAWLVPTGVAVLATSFVLAAIPERYTARSEILIDAGPAVLVRSDASDGATAEAVDEAAVTSAAQTIASADIARRASQALDLAGNPDVDPLAGGMDPLSRLMTLLGLHHDPMSESVDARMVDAFESRLEVRSPRGSRVITIAFTDRDPALAARVANEIVDLFLEERTAGARTAAKDAVDALASRITALRRALGDAEAARAIPSPGRGATTSVGQPSADIAANLARARSEQADAQTKADAIRALLHDNRPADVAEITTSPTLRQLASQRTAAQTELTLEARTLLPEHPRVKELVGQIKDYDVALKAAAKQVATSLDNQAKAAGQRMSDLEAALARQEKNAAVADASTSRARAADRDIQGLRDQLGTATLQYDRLVAARASAQPSPNARVILRAAAPRDPSFPEPVPVVIAAALATMLCAMAWVVAGDRRRLRPAGHDAGSPFLAHGGRDAETVPPSTDPVVVPEPTPRPADRTAPPSFEPRRGPLARFAVQEPSVPDQDADDLVVASPEPPRPRRDEGARAFLPRVRSILAKSKATLVAFGRPGSESRHLDEPGSASFDDGGVGWDVERELPEPSTVEIPNPVDHAAIADRVVAGHVPGRGLHVVGAGIGSDADASRDLVATARALAERGRCIVVDLNATPSRLASLVAADNGRLAVMALDGLAELLAGEASFAEVIHRDHATRLHFIPTGRKEADFRDFDLILDALTETYDFIVLLAPAFPQSEIAKVMAPYADVVILSAPGDVDDATLDRLEGELTAAGARDVLVTGRGSRWHRDRAQVA